MVQGPSRATAILHSIQHLLMMNSNSVSFQSEQGSKGAVRGSRYYSEMKKKSFKLVTDQVFVIIC